MDEEYLLDELASYLMRKLVKYEDQLLATMDQALISQIVSTATVIMISFNLMAATTGIFGAQRKRDVLQAVPTLTQPSSWLMALWTFLYVLAGIMAYNEDLAVIPVVAARFVMTVVSEAAWLLLWCHERFLIATLVAGFYVGYLWSAYAQLDELEQYSSPPQSSNGARLLYSASWSTSLFFSAQTALASTALLISFPVCFASYGHRWGAKSSIVLLVAVTVMALIVLRMTADVAFAATIVVALLAIGHKNYNRLSLGMGGDLDVAKASLSLALVVAFSSVFVAQGANPFDLVGSLLIRPRQVQEEQISSTGFFGGLF